MPNKSQKITAAEQRITAALRKAIESSGMKPAEICRQSGLLKSTLSRLRSKEYRTVSLDTVVRVSGALGFELQLVKVKGS